MPTYPPMAARSPPDPPRDPTTTTPPLRRSLKRKTTPRSPTDRRTRPPSPRIVRTGHQGVPTSVAQGRLAGDSGVRTAHRITVAVSADPPTIARAAMMRVPVERLLCTGRPRTRRPCSSRQVMSAQRPKSRRPRMSSAGAPPSHRRARRRGPGSTGRPRSPRGERRGRRLAGHGYRGRPSGGRAWPSGPSSCPDRRRRATQPRRLAVLEGLGQRLLTDEGDLVEAPPRSTLGRRQLGILPAAGEIAGRARRSSAL